MILLSSYCCVFVSVQRVILDNLSVISSMPVPHIFLSNLQLSNEKDKENDRVRKVSDALKQSETDGQVASLQQEELEKQVSVLPS